MQALIETVFDTATGTATHVVYDRRNGYAAVIDPVLDYDAKAGRIRTTNADRVLALLASHGLTLQWILETHAHADHLSAAQYLKQQAGGRVAIGENILAVQQTFKRLFNLGDDFNPDGTQFDQLLAADEVITIGELHAEVLAVPGHTAADIAFQIGDIVFVGDTLFMPDVGTARCDFPGGDARVLYQSIRKLLDLPAETRLLLCHDYPPAQQRAPVWESTVGAQRAANIHVRDGIGEDEFVAMRNQRDMTLDVPLLILPAVQVNIRAGSLPQAESNGVQYLKIPLNALGRSRAG
ncbi:MBL fold metallo-hydrolase [Silvimonas sp.]|uniref:MBL fold metallo-hydrolase n=1 Tax=Silvimonas sp. TaxID=2650811 RepID=UPI00283C6FF9|nr:MBL fold metallo-hydrolase [Silvimonas sp.]MDR3428955.1 MBL fold metallo-hydrolase [Silvimonas sp.]